MKNLLILLLLLSFFSKSLSQDNAENTIHLTQLPPEGIVLNKGWKYHSGDSPDWAKPGFDDKNWQQIDPTKDIRDIPELWKTDIGWFRLRFTIDSSLTQKGIAVLVEQTGASEIFMNGRLLKQFGKISDNVRKVQAATPVIGSFIGLPVSKPGEQVLAVRFAIPKNIPYIVFADRPNQTLALQVIETQAISSYLESNITVYFDFARTGLFLILSVLHLALFFFNPSQKGNLYFFIFTFVNCLSTFFIGIVYEHAQFAATKTLFFILSAVSFWVAFLFFLTAVYKTFNYPRRLIYWLSVTAFFLSIFFLFNNYHNGFNFGSVVFINLVFLDSLRITIPAAKEKKRGAKLVVAGISGFLVFYLLFYLFAYGYIPGGPYWIFGHLAFNISFLSLPIAISVYLALESSFANRLLKEKLKEVEQLSQRTLEQEQEKQQILSQQNETLEKQVQQRTSELSQSLKDLKETQSQLVQREKMASLGELTAGIAHEIQNPLNFVNNFSEVNTELIDELKSEKSKVKSERSEELENEILNDISQNLEKIARHGKRADAIVKGMLQHSRASTGKKQPTDVNALADEYLRLSYHGLRAKDKSFNATFKTDFDETIGKIEVIPQDMGRVLLNLYNNAFYSVNEKKKAPALKGENYEPIVSVQTKRENDKVIIAVSDNGIGIPQKAVDKIFQPFFTTKPTGQGTGLGLSLSYDIVKGHGGELKVETKENEGAEFIIQLPLKQL